MPFLFSKHVNHIGEFSICHQNNASLVLARDKSWFHISLQYLHYFQRQTDKYIQHDQNTPLLLLDVVSFDQTVFFNFASECQLTLEAFKTLPLRAYYQGHHQKLHNLLLPSAAQFNAPYIQWVLSAQAMIVLIRC